jgi:hypothetical protein
MIVQIVRTCANQGVSWLAVRGILVSAPLGSNREAVRYARTPD